MAPPIYPGMEKKMVSSTGQNMEDNKTQSSQYEKDEDSKDIYYSDTNNSPYRDTPVPIEYYRQIKSDLLKLIKEKNKKISLLVEESQRKTWTIESLDNKYMALKEYHENKKKNSWVKAGLTLIFMYFAYLGGIKLYVYLELKNPSGESGIRNAESSLRRHLSAMNQTNISSLSCRIYPQNSEASDICNRYSYGFCISSHSENAQIQPQERYYCCSRSVERLNNGCIMINGRITNGSFREAR